MSVFPSITKVLAAEDVHPVRYVKLGAADGLRCLCGVDSPSSLASKQMLVKGVRLHAGEAVPFHEHSFSEMLYVFQGPGTVCVYVATANGIKKFALTADSMCPVVVPRKHPHGLYCVESGGDRPCHLLAIASYHDASKIAWEPAFQT